MQDLDRTGIALVAARAAPALPSAAATNAAATAATALCCSAASGGAAIKAAEGATWRAVSKALGKRSRGELRPRPGGSCGELRSRCA